MNGKDKCRILKQIRKEIAENNNIEWTVSECRHKGNCKGTCPKCEAEVRKLEEELSLRRRLGKAVSIVGVSTLCVAGLTACSFSDLPLVSSLFGSDHSHGNTSYTEELDGEVAIEDIEVIETTDGTEPEIFDLAGDVPYEG